MEEHTRFHDVFHDLTMKIFLMDVGEEPGGKILMAGYTDTYFFHTVTHFFRKGTGQRPVVPDCLKLFVIPVDDLVE
jgi:hypothetical protein